MCLSPEMCLNARPPASTSSCPAQRRNPGEHPHSIPTSGKEVGGKAQLGSWPSNCLATPNEVASPLSLPTLLGAKISKNTAGRLGLFTQLECPYAFPSHILHGCTSAGSECLCVLDAAMLPQTLCGRLTHPFPNVCE